MRLLNLPILLASPLILPTLISSFKVWIWQNNNYSGPADYTVDRGSDGDCEWFEGGYSFKYDSKIGCALSTWSDAECNAGKAVMRRQHVCFTPDYKAFAFQCAV